MQIYNNSFENVWRREMWFVIKFGNSFGKKKNFVFVAEDAELGEISRSYGGKYEDVFSFS